MSLHKLTFPIRAYWDLPEDFEGPVDPMSVSSEMVRCGILSLDLWEPAVSIRPRTLEIARRFIESNRAVSLTVASAALKTSLVTSLSGLGLSTLLVQARSLGEIGGLAGRITALETAAGKLGISFQVNPENIGDLPRVLTRLVDCGVSLLVLPIERPDAGNQVHSFENADHEGLAEQLRQIDYRSVQVIAHDPFLWAALYPDAALSPGGCQAGCGLIHIKPDYSVYPCPILPVCLGNLADHSLKQIVSSSEMKRVKEILGELPETCAGCPKSPNCHGGCRGRAYVVRGSLKERDPACRL